MSLEANDQWTTARYRYMQTEVMADLTPPLIDTVPTTIATAGSVIRFYLIYTGISTTLTDVTRREGFSTATR